MLARTLLSLVNLVVLTVTLAVWFAFPQFSNYALYACFGWIVVAFAIMYSSWGHRPVGASARAAPAGAPLPSGSGGGSRTSAPAAGAPLDFCIYCASYLPAGAPRCPACGRAVVRA